jgi:hypothetical protein
MFLNFADIQMTCYVVEHSVIQPMVQWLHPIISWLPMENDFSYSNPDLDAGTITFRLIWAFSHELIGFMGLFQCILQLFFLVDMLMTWRNPLKYMQIKNKVVPLFLICSKVVQVIIFIIVKKPKVMRITLSVVSTLQLLFLTVFFIVEFIRKKKQKFSNRVLYLVFTRYALPLFSFCGLTLALVHQSEKDQNAITDLFFSKLNIIAPSGTLIFIIFKIFEPQT